MTSTSTNKIIAATALVLLLTGLAASSHYYGGYDSGYGQEYGITGQTGFSVPHFDSQRELLVEFVAPFIFISVLLQLALNRALLFTFAADDDRPKWLTEKRPSYSREATIMSLAITGMLVPSPFWQYVRLAIQSLGIIVIVGAVLMVFYLVSKMTPSGGGTAED